MQLCTIRQNVCSRLVMTMLRDRMEQLERASGRAVRSSAYNKVGRLVQHCQKAVPAGQGIDLDEALILCCISWTKL